MVSSSRGRIARMGHGIEIFEADEILETPPYCGGAASLNKI